MNISSGLIQFGLSRYELTAYLNLVEVYPVNGSQLAKKASIPRAKIYDVLQGLVERGLVVRVEDNLFAPLPPKEFIKRLRQKFESNLEDLEEKLSSAKEKVGYDYVWTITGYSEVMGKAKEMITLAEEEIYVRLFPHEALILDPVLKEAEERGVKVKYISMGIPGTNFKYQIIHHDIDEIEETYKGRTFDVIVDRQEILVGLFEKGKEEGSPINWAKHHWFVVSGRDSLRHDFFHCLLHKSMIGNTTLTKEENELYRLIEADA